QVSAPDRYVYDYDWSPRSDAIVATAAHGSGDDHWYGAQLVVFHLASGTEEVIVEPQMQIATPRWSPDSRLISFLGGLMSDESVAAGDLYLIQSTGGLPRNVTPGFAGSIFASLWSGDSRGLILTAARNGGATVLTLDVGAGRLRTLWSGPETLTAVRDLAFSISLARDRRQAAVIRQSFDQPPSVWVGPIGKWQRRSADIAPPPLYGRAESVHWWNEGLELQGWLIPPARLAPGRRYPLVINVHGGPAWLIAPSWPTLDADSQGAVLASQDYFVFFPNVRGSTGYGERVTRANFRDVGGAPLRDILAAVRELVRDQPVDPQRIGLTGWSYGGYMTMWALTQTSMFRAAVAGAGVANWQSYTGENGIDASLVPYFGATVYDDPEIYARSSPINFIKQVRTPTLIVVGDSDVECPAPQSYEYWHALKTLGIPTRLVVYPHEGHQFADPEHIIDYLERSRDWFDRYMPAQSADARN
ncbi:MAG: S9 family peptidase, partial [Sinobacteraceae bacterium]|nr:S9 family peptidase [Nevskiaceae bacterium]